MEVRQGKVEAQTMKTEDGRSILLIAGIGPGPAEAVITFPSGSGLQSQTGKTIAEGERYHFTGNDICCDILK